MYIIDNPSQFVYRPKTDATHGPYKLLLSFTQGQIGDHPTDLMRGAAHEVLSVLKDEAVRDSDRQKAVESLLNAMPAEKFNKLVNIGKKITDFSAEQKEAFAEDTLEEELVPVIFEEDDEEEEDEIASECLHPSL